MMKGKDTAFAPTQRVDFGEALLPPEGYRLEAALGTTYSMDFLTALTVPVSLALRGGMEPDEIASSPLAALAAMRRLESRVMICVEAANIHVPSGKRNALVSLLEGIVCEIAPPIGASFHPKLWILRFAPERDGPMLQRLIMMSRNLTRDRSWDFALRLEGVEQNSVNPGIAPLTDLIVRQTRALNKIKSQNMPLIGLIDWLLKQTAKPRGSVFHSLRDGLARTKWTSVPGFSAPRFSAHYPRVNPNDLWRPGKGQLAVVSPFCDDGGLDLLGRDRIAALVASEDWLARLGASVQRSFTLMNHAVPESDPGATPTAEDRAGLHAKLYILEHGGQTEITIGSGNATAAGLGAKGVRNIEVYATLRGKTAEVGGIGLDGEGFLGSNGLGPLLSSWAPRLLLPDEEAMRRFSEAAREARRLIFAAQPLLHFQQEDERLSVLLTLDLPALPAVLSIYSRLVTQAVQIPLEGNGPWRLGSVRLADATTFLQFDLHGHDERERESFVTQAKSEGLPKPEARLQALLSDIIKTPEQFLHFVTAMLEKRPDLNGLLGGPGGHGAAGKKRREPPVLEAMLAAYLSEDGWQRLSDLDRVVRLMKRDLGNEKKTIKEFLSLWDEFLKAMGKKA